jgi:hypothetical protein
MLVEVAKPVTLLIVFSILSLYAVFSTAFLVPSSDMHQRIFDSLSRLALAAVISLIGGLILREEPKKSPAERPRLTATLPVQIFCWAVSAMFVLFLVSCYGETYCVFYRDVRL